MKVVVDATSKEFGKVLATDNINLEIKPATVHGLLGSNGAGKTTLLKIMSGIYKADKGRVTYDGKKVYEPLELKKDVVSCRYVPMLFSGSPLKKLASPYQSMSRHWTTERFQQLSKHFGLSPDVQLSQLLKCMKR